MISPPKHPNGSVAPLRFLDLHVQAGPPTARGALPRILRILQLSWPNSWIQARVSFSASHRWLSTHSCPCLQPGHTLPSLSFKTTRRPTSNCSISGCHFPGPLLPFLSTCCTPRVVPTARVMQTASFNHWASSPDQGLSTSPQLTPTGVQLRAGGGSGISTWDS